MLLQSADSGARQTSRAASGWRRSRLANERGAALLEAAITLPLVLLVSVSIFEFGRAYQTYQVVTNAAREGARVAILPGSSVADVQSRVVAYLRAGQLPDADRAAVAVNQNATVSIGATTAGASVVTVSYPFSFMMLNALATLVVGGSGTGEVPFALSATSQMRNEAQ
jgi:Flp pilus assembly protein TadG